MQKVLVTGATGFLGRHLLLELTKEYKVRALTRGISEDLGFGILSPEEKIRIDQVEWIRGDLLSSSDKMEGWLEGVKLVFHLGGVVGYEEFPAVRMREINVHATHRLLKAALKKGVDVFFHFSSVVVFGATRKKEVLSEEEVRTIDPSVFWPYADTKREAQELVISEGEQHGIQTLLINPSTVYGPYDWLKGSRRMQLKTMKKGSLFYTEGGVSVVDYRDVLTSVKRILECGKKNRPYIIAAENFTIKELLEAICDFSSQSRRPTIQIPYFLIHNMHRLLRALSNPSSRLEKLLQQLQIASHYHWYRSDRAISELGINFRSAKDAVKESVTSFLKSVHNSGD